MAIAASPRGSAWGSGATTPGPSLSGGDVFISVKAVEWVLNFSQSTGNSRNVLIAIAVSCDHDGVCWPGLNELERRANISRPAVLRAIKELETLGELAVERGGRGPKDTNTYTLPRFMETVTMGNVSDEKGNDTPPKRVTTPLPEEEVLEEERVISTSSLSKFEEDLQRKQARREAKQARKAGIRAPFARPAKQESAILSVKKQPVSWIWFAVNFKRITDVNAFAHPDLFPLVDEMLREIDAEEVRERLSLYIDGAGKVTGYLAKDFLTGGWRTVSSNDESMPRLIAED
jgi:Helix-turn-helix domain